MSINVRDRDILTNSFRLMCGGVPNRTMNAHLNKQKFYNIFSTAVGDNRYVNPLPQFSPATDPRPYQFLVSKEGGMGGMFKTVYDDNFSLATFTVGVPEFTGLLSFILNAFDPVSAVMANKGRAPSFTFYIGQMIGTVAFWPVQLLNIGFQFLAYLTNTPTNQFYYVKPTMGLYLNTANRMLNDFMSQLGYIKPILPMHHNDVSPVNGIEPMRAEAYQHEINRLTRIFGDNVNPDGTIDLMRMVGKGQRKYRMLLSRLAELDNQALNSPLEKYDAMAKVWENFNPNESTMNMSLETYLNKEIATTGKVRSDQESSYPEVASAFTKKSANENVVPSGVAFEVTDAQGNVRTIQGQQGTYLNTSDRGNQGNSSGGGTGLSTDGTYTQANAGSGQPQPATQPELKQDEKVTRYYYEDDAQDRGWLGNIYDLVKTGWYGGFDAITWRVEHMGSVTDSFNNSFAPSPLADKFNSTVKAVNEFKYDMGGFKTGVGLIDKTIEMASDAVMGLASSMTIANVPMALANNSYVNIPEHWADASANIHRESYRIRLEATHGHPYAQVTQIWALLSLLFPLFMPRNTGGSSYTSPFMLKVFSKSRQVIRVGMVESATIIWGDGPGGWSKDRKPLNVTVELSIADMEKFISIPMASTSNVLEAVTNPASAVKKMLTDVGKYNEYLTRITGTDYLDTVLRWNNLSKRLTRTVTNWKQDLSSQNIAGGVIDSIVGDIGQLPFRPLSR